MDLGIFLQETTYLVDALNKSLPDLGKNFYLTHYGNYYINPNTVVCRGIEILFNEGYNSGKYRKILSNECYRQAIKINCAKERRETFNNLNFNGHFIKLYDEETYFKDQWRDLFKNIDDLYRSANNLFGYFIDWWFFGKDLKQNPHEYMGTCDVLNPRHTESVELFNLLFPSIFFIVLFLSAKKENTIIWKLLFNDPCYTPDFELMDVWLKRKALERMVGLFGIDKIIPHFKRIDGDIHLEPDYSLLDYVTAKLGIKFTERQKDLLKKYDMPDPEIRFSERSEEPD